MPKKEAKKRNELKFDLLEKAIKAFQAETGFKLDTANFYAPTAGKEPDAKLKLKTKGEARDLLVEIKPVLNDVTAGQFAHVVADNPGKWIIVTRHVPPPLAKKMKELHLQFIDTAGNAYIADAPLFVFTYGNKLEKTEPDIGEKGGFGQADVKVIFAMLCKKELEQATYREIAEAANVALGTVAGALKDLTRLGFLLDMGTRGRRLVKKKELFDKWVIAYAEKLRHNILIGKYTTENMEEWGKADMTKYNARWGGEHAAQKMTGYLKPEIVTIYAQRPVNDLVLAFKLRKDTNGNIELREQFWNFEAPDKENNLVPPLLVYADLLATTNTRNIETAKMIYDDILQRYIG